MLRGTVTANNLKTFLHDRFSTANSATKRLKPGRVFPIDNIQINWDQCKCNHGNWVWNAGNIL